MGVCMLDKRLYRHRHSHSHNSSNSSILDHPHSTNMALHRSHKLQATDNHSTSQGHTTSSGRSTTRHKLRPLPPRSNNSLSTRAPASHLTLHNNSLQPLRACHNTLMVRRRRMPIRRHTRCTTRHTHKDRDKGIRTSALTSPLQHLSLRRLIIPTLPCRPLVSTSSSRT